MIRSVTTGGSSSSVYMSDEEGDESVVEIEKEEKEYRVQLGKRKKNSGTMKEVSDTEMDERRANKEKRRQDETSIIMEETRKIREDKTQRTKKIMETEDSDMEPEESNTEQHKAQEEKNATMDFEDAIKTVQDKIKRIIKAVGKESSGKITVTRSDQQIVKDSATGILNDVIGIILNQIAMEKKCKETELVNIKKEEELKQLRKQLKDQGREGKKKKIGREYGTRRIGLGGLIKSSGDSDSETTANERKRTYAEVSMKGTKQTWERVGKKGKIAGRVVLTGEEGWKTPPLAEQRAKEQAVIVSGKKGQNSKKLVEDITKKVGVKDIGGPPKAVRKIKDGRVIIISKDGEQATRIAGCLNKVEGVEATLKRKMLPLLRISGVDKGIVDTELITKIKQGADISMGEEMKIIRRITCRNIWKENVILQTTLEAFKTIVKRGKVEIDCVLYFAEEYLGLSQCYRCCRFGHIMKACSEKEVCCLCAGGNDSRECKTKERKCPNCWRMYGKKLDHSARDSVCPAFKRFLERSRQNLSYKN